MPTSLKHTDPTYLRTIHDGLLTGAVHKDNASALPQGLVGMYEEALPPASNVRERKNFLVFFAVWALLKREVSAGFVVPLLEGWFKKLDLNLRADALFRKREEEVLEYIAQFSKWFNSPAGGTYVLYHERLRAFVLQKISDAQFKACNEAIINQCRVSLEAKAGEEWERYALEHLSAHLLIQAMERKDATALKALAYNTAHWNRQVEISKGFEWSKRMLNDMMLWASKYDDDQVIECALNKVDLHHLEQNDAPRIVELVAQNDIETALQRIEAFGGNDKEGLQRKFILYMLCLMELTLLESKTKLFRKTAIEKLLNHLDEHIPTDTSIINWNEFFSSYLMFQLACVWAEHGMDYLIVYKRTKDWDIDWISVRGPYESEQFQVLRCITRCMNSDYKKSNALKGIAVALFKQGQIEESASVLQESLAIAQGISYRSDKSSAINAISLELSKQGQLDEALAIARGISDKSEKSSALNAISAELSKQGQMEESESIMQESLTIARGISEEYWKGRALKDIAVELSKQAQVAKSLAIARGISDDYWKSIALNDIALEQSKLGQFEESVSVMQESLAIAQGISDESKKSSALNAISAGLSKQDKLEESASLIEESLFVAKEIDDYQKKRIAFDNILVQLTKRGKVKESLAIIQDFGYDWQKNSALKAIALELAEQGQVDEPLSIARSINNELEKSMALSRICIEMSEQGRLDVSISLMLEMLSKALDFNDGDNINSVLKAISTELSLHGRHDESLFIAQCISDDYWKGCALKDLAVHLSKKGLVEESLSIARSISDELEKCRALSGICIEVSKMGMLELSRSIIQETHDLSQFIGDLYQNSHAIYEIANSQLKQGLIFESIITAQNIRWNLVRNRVLIDIAAELTKQDRLGDALNIVTDMHVESISKAIPPQFSAIAGALTAIAIELSTQGHHEESILKISESIEITTRMKGERNKIIALMTNAVALKPYRPQESNLLIKESLFVARNIRDDRKRSYAVRDVAVELANQGLFALAENVGMEIPLAIDRQQCWEKIANKAVVATSWQKSLEPIALLKSQESQFFYKRGWANAIEIFHVNADCIRAILPVIAEDPETIQKILHKYATQELVLGNPPKELTARLNRTLNIQWALDIVAQFPKPDATPRLSTNLDTWLQEIVDEDDRDQIELWAKQVAKGKITEEEFGERVKNLK